MKHSHPSIRPCRKNCHTGLLVVSGVCFMVSLVTAGVIPDGYPAGRYSLLCERSPFTIPSVQQEPVTAGFATKLALVGVAKIGSEDLVILFNKDSQERITLGSKANAAGLKLIAVERSQDPMKVNATIQKGTEVAQVKFDQALLASSAGSQNAPGNSPQQPPAAAAQATVQSLGVNPPPLRIRRTLPIPVPIAAQSAPVNPLPSPGMPLTQ